MSFLDDLRNVNPNDPSSWPLPVKIGGIGVTSVLILVAGFWFLIQGGLDEYAAGQKKEEGLRETFLSKKALAVNLPAYKQQMEDMRRTFGSLLRQLPNTTEVPDLLVDITQAGLGRGLEFVLFRPEKESPKDFYAELPISIEIRGSYHDLAQFISDVAALPRIVTVGDISVGAPGGAVKGNALSMSARARTYRYLDDTGSAAKAPAKPGKK
ncbi:MAG TPA: type 4a pilus biogenesis protein PilO [Burkholderiales bacterium]|nr:type 4a pilus biogenesis protein PilO [Burkholderiales bacterium]